MQLSECRWCGMTHGPQCPSVKAIDFFPDGTVKRVEFQTAAGAAPYALAPAWRGNNWSGYD